MQLAIASEKQIFEHFIWLFLTIKHKFGFKTLLMLIFGHVKKNSHWMSRMNCVLAQQGSPRPHP